MYMHLGPNKYKWAYKGGPSSQRPDMCQKEERKVNGLVIAICTQLHVPTFRMLADEERPVYGIQTFFLSQQYLGKTRCNTKTQREFVFGKWLVSLQN